MQPNSNKKQLKVGSENKIILIELWRGGEL